MSDFSAGQPAGGGVSANPAGGGVATPSPSSVDPSQASATPAVIELNDDSMVRLPGQKDPVKYGDYYRGFQSQFTRKAQEAAENTRRLQALQAEHQRLQQQWQQVQAQRFQQQQRQPGNDLREAIRQLPYLSGEDAARVVEHISGQINSYDAALQQRDAALVLLTKQLMATREAVNSLQARTMGSDFDSKIKRFVADQGLPPEAEELAKEIYLAYEGEDLDQEFPTILSNRWKQMENLFTAAQRRKVEEARSRSFLPGKGGQGVASQPLKDLSTKSPKEIADAIWPGMVDGAIET